MRDLFDRMFGPSTRQYEAIAVHTLPSYLADYALGGQTRKEITNHFRMIDRDRLEVNRLFDQVDAATTQEEKIALVTYFEFIMRIEEALPIRNRERFKKRLGI